MPPVITVGPTYTTTDSTIVATWTTDTSSDSNLSAGGKAAIDNGVATNSTSHQCIVAGLSPSTIYSCVVTSGGTSSFPQNVTTSAAHTSTPVTSVQFGSPTTTTNDGDIFYSFTSNDNITYMTRDDAAVPGTSANQQLDSITNETTLAISQINALTNYGHSAFTNGTDGPGGVALSNKANGLFGMAGSLFMFTGRHQITGNTRKQFYGNVIRSDDKGLTWSNFSAPTTFDANGLPYYPNSGTNSIAPFFFGGNSNFGWVTPVRYAADDGTLGYTTTGNGFDGGNAYCYFTIIEQVNDAADYIYLGRIPRIKLFTMAYTAEQFWIGPTSPTAADFVNDSNWQSASTGLTKIYTNVGKVGWQDICFIPAINRYLLFSVYRPSVASTSNTVWLVMEGETPAGPWTQVGSLTNNPSGYYCQSILHRTAFSNIKTQLIPLTVIYSGDFQNAAVYYHPTFSTLTLLTGGIVANSFVQGKGTVNATSPTGTTGTLAYTSNVTSGNLLVCSWRYNPSGGTLSNVTSTRTTGNWNIVYDQSDGGTPIRDGWAWAFATSTGACTVTLTFSASVVGINIAECEYNGPIALRATSTAAVTNETALTSNAATAVAGDLQLGFVTVGASTSNTFTAGAGYTKRTNNLIGGVTEFTAIEDLLTSAGGSVTASWTSSENSAAIKAVVGVGIFTSVFSISGSAGVASAQVAYSGTASGSVTADGTGAYSIPSLGPGTYTLTPTLAGYTFSPTSSSPQTITNANISGVNFTASLISTGPPGTVTITMLDSSTVTLSIPNGYTATQFVQALRRGGGVWSAAPDPATSATWWPYRDWKKFTTS